MNYLVDANVLSEMTKPSPDSKVVQWLTTHEASLVVDPIILGEVRIGILALPAGRKRAKLEHWFDAVVQAIVCLPWDAAVALRWAELLAKLQRNGMKLPVLD